MKTFRVIGIALFAVLLCVNFTSCAEDGPEANGGGTPTGKQLAKLDVTNENLGQFTYTLLFYYDDKGKVVKIENIDRDYNGEQSVATYLFTWGDDIIKYQYSKPGSHGDSHIFTLKDGFIQKGGNGDVFTYNSSRLVRSNEGSNVNNLIWNSDKLVSYFSNDDSYYSKTITYEKTCKKGYFPLIPYLVSFKDYYQYLFLANPEIAGLRTSQLPTKIVKDYDNDNILWAYTYEFDSEGYISTITEENPKRGVTKYTLTWQ